MTTWNEEFQQLVFGLQQAWKHHDEGGIKEALTALTLLHAAYKGAGSPDHDEEISA